MIILYVCRRRVPVAISDARFLSCAARPVVVTAKIRFRIDGRWTKVRSQWRNTLVSARPLSHADLFIYLGRGA